MAVSPTSSACLELTISVPGTFASSEGGAMRDLDINQVPSEEELIEEDDQNPNHDGAPPRKKLRLTKQQSRLLEESFRQNHTLNPKQKETLAMELKLKPRQVEVWFQNRRARSKLKQTEMECEYLKRWFGSLSEQNRRLQKEVEELRAMKVAPPTVMTSHSSDPLLASTLTMCPQCERVTTTTAQPNAGPIRPSASKPSAMAAAKVPVIHSRHSSPAC
ncbi:homeobox-leucine zipper protein HOX3 isoform X2 [Daucus carota subsp. sativus]|uniref:homeobox-leucine zipper protein HOX3 isoform X2 n=1 Tax=Daucus carota subsp. sativus TaxID=79200 RepID=UPI0007EF856E|nr:PREDICTED: homeobox-leucine zipper protein HOX3 isoform X2 [Daucus carota subsp. sativus]